ILAVVQLRAFTSQAIGAAPIASVSRTWPSWAYLITPRARRSDSMTCISDVSLILAVVQLRAFTSQAIGAAPIASVSRTWPSWAYLITPRARRSDSMTSISRRARPNPARLWCRVLWSLFTRRSAASTRSWARSRSVIVYWRGSDGVRFFRGRLDPRCFTLARTFGPTVEKGWSPLCPRLRPPSLARPSMRSSSSRFCRAGASNCVVARPGSPIVQAASRLTLRVHALRAAAALTRLTRWASGLSCGRQDVPADRTVDPRYIVAKHRVEDGDDLTHHSDEDDLGF